MANTMLRDEMKLANDYSVVLHKALAGCGMLLGELAQNAGIAEGALREFAGGDFDAAVARAVSGPLGLSSDVYAAHPGYRPRAPRVEGVFRLITPFEDDDTVNTWLFRDGHHWLAFDAGDHAEVWHRKMIERTGMPPEVLLITHGHPDHIAGLPFARADGTRIHAPERLCGAEVIGPGADLHIADWRVETCDLSGHYTPSLGYFLHHAGREFLVCGDALFAGSIGRCLTPADYRMALQTLREALAGKSDDLIILPGHGPATTLGQERTGNPFLG